ncbi:lipid-A-disaccharide synthase [Fulvivirgaceae bacterium BMA12]|uniref:Lipid-A-disaccharide synthase n=1 Tax=Agaribacillus aureus TaxID=3051825 RepID=A0ABT8LIC4_9BACT|nr:lipid-A-disaccharide synthase [Fulvivirgaceae bacterium BMA12]
MKYYIIAGERSGDLHAANLVKSLRQLDADLEIRGIGGDYMKESGVQILMHYKELAVMGFLEVLKSIFRLRKFLQKCQNDVAAFKPDVLILVDFAGFNMRMAKFGKANNFRTFYYISPKIWAWNQKRALKIKKSVDKMFVILPFEKDFYKRYDYPVDYVGNPLLDAINAFQPNDHFSANNRLDDKKIIAVLPGSRQQEVAYILEIMLSVINDFPDYRFVVAGVDNLSQEAYKVLDEIDRVSLVYDQTYDLLTQAQAAIVTSGTATLETALLNVPQVVCYRTSNFTYRIAKHLIKVEYISLVNLIAGQEVVRELIQHELNYENLKNAVRAILPGGPERQNVLSGYVKVHELLGNKKASQTTARLMVDYLS